MTDRRSRPDGRPTRTSTTVGIALALGLAAAYAGAAGVLATAAAGAVGAACLAVALWTSRWERGQSVGALLASLLALPVGLGLLAATAGTYLVLASAAFPVAESETVRSILFGVVATVLLVTALFGVVFGALASARSLLERRTVGRSARVVLGAAAVPLVPGALAGLAAGLAYLEAERPGPGAIDAFGGALGAVDALLLDPPVVRPHPATFALLVGVAAVVAGRALEALPVAELVANRTDRTDQTGRADGGNLADDTGGIDWSRAVSLVERGLTVGGAAAIATVPPFLLLELLSPGALPASIAGVVASGPVRGFAVGVTVVGLLAVGVVRLLRWGVRTSVDSVGAALAPFLGGAVVVGLVVVAAEPVLTGTVDWVVGTLPSPFDEVAGSVAGSVIDVYGPVTIGLLVTGALFLAVAAVLGVLWVLAVGGVLDGRTGGGRIAGGGLFLAAATAAVVGVSRPLVLAGIVGGLVVADLDAYATTLGDEIGRRAGTGRTEVLHAVGTIAVAASGAVVALAVASLTASPPTTDPAVALVGLLGGLAGAVVLLAALR